MNDFIPLSEDEHRLLAHLTRWGSDGYPIQRMGRGWSWGPFGTIKGPPVVFRTKREAVQSFEAYVRALEERHKAERFAGRDRSTSVTRREKRRR